MIGNMKTANGPDRGLPRNVPGDRLKALELSALAGLEAGVVGGVSMLLFLCAHSALRGQYWWSYPNLLGSVAYGSSAFWRGLGRATAAGISVELLLSGAAGVLFGVCFARTRGRMVSLLLGLSCGVIWFFFTFGVLFRAIGPLVPVYASEPATLLAHMILGLVLSRTSMLYVQWPPGWRLLEVKEAKAAASGIPNANELRGANEIVPRHRLE
jgi:hypothetical protein